VEKGHLTCIAEETKYKGAIIRTEANVLYCPECETSLDVDEDEVDEGEILSCPECGMDFEVATVNPVELKSVEEEEKYEDDEEEEIADGDDS
jgi:alpha-aminoadipate carrier protein LysW